MFFNISRKTTAYVMITVFITLIFTMISILRLSKSLINVDYSQKVMSFFKQEAFNCSVKLELLSTNMDYIADELGVNSTFISKKTSAEINLLLQKKVNYSPYIEDLYIYNGKKMAYYFRSKEKAPNFNEYLNYTESKNIWLPLSSEKPNKIYYIKSCGDNCYIVFLVNINEIFDAFKDTVSFLKKENTFIYAQNNKYIFLTQEPSKQNLKNSFEGKYDKLIFEKGKIIYSHNIGETGLKVCTISTDSYIKSISDFITKVFFVILTLTMCLCLYMINKFSKEINSELADIHSKIVRYNC